MTTQKFKNLIGYAFVGAFILAIVFAIGSDATYEPEITEAAASEVRLTTSELQVINEQEAILLDKQAQKEQLEIEIERTQQIIQMLEHAECSYQDLTTCTAIIEAEEDVMTQEEFEAKKAQGSAAEKLSSDNTVDPTANLNEHEARIYNTCTKLGMTLEESAFVLANANHETAQFKYMYEIDGRNQAVRLNYQGGAEYFGRGYIQLTHRNNYEMWSKWLNRDLVANPNIVAEDLDLSAHIACSGIQHGSFTAIEGGIRSFNSDWYNARALVNGDKHKRAGCEGNNCWTIGTKIKDLTNHYISIIK